LSPADPTPTEAPEPVAVAPAGTGGIGAALDALVGLSASGENDEQMAAAVALLKRWKEEGSVLKLDGRRLRIGDEVVMEADEHKGAWLPPASVAGLRAIRPLAGCTPAEMASLATTLAGLADSPAAVSELRDLLWCDGVGGFEIDSRGDWAGRIDMVAEREGARDELDAQRAQAVQTRTLAFARSRGAGAAEIAPAAARMDAWVKRLGQARLQPPVLAALRKACDGGVFWTEGLAALLNGHAELQANLTPGGVARTILDIFGHGGDLRAPEAIAAMGGADESPLAIGRANIDLTALGEATGRSLALDGNSVKQLAALFAGPDVPFTKGVANGLLSRAAAKGAAEGIARAVQAVGTRDLWRHANLAGASDAVTRGVALVLKGADADATCWADLVGWSSPGVAAWILRNAPPVVLSRVEGNLKEMLSQRTPQENAPLIQALAEQGSTSALRSLAEALHETRGKGWAGKVVPVICHALMRKGMGAQYLVPLFRDREVDTKMRLLVLRTLEAQPDLLAEAVRFHVGELVEPPAIKERLKAARKRLKGQG